MIELYSESVIDVQGAADNDEQKSAAELTLGIVLALFAADFPMSQARVALKPLWPDSIMMENTYLVHLPLTMNTLNKAEIGRKKKRN